MHWRFATADDSPLLAEFNHQLIADEGHKNPMDQAQLEQRMRAWLESEYRAVLFQRDDDVVAYALYRADEQSRIHLRQFFVHRSHRRQGIGREAMRVLRTAVVPDQRLMIEVLIANKTGRAFWAAAGFRDYSITMECAPTDADQTHEKPLTATDSIVDGRGVQAAVNKLYDGQAPQHVVDDFIAERRKEAKRER